MLARAFLILNCKTLTICDNHMLNRKLMWKDLRKIRRCRWFSGLESKIRCRRKFSEIFDYVSPRKTLLEANSRRPLPACQSSANFSPIARQRASRGSFCSPICGANNAATVQSGCMQSDHDQYHQYLRAGGLNRRMQFADSPTPPLEFVPPPLLNFFSNRKINFININEK